MERKTKQREAIREAFERQKRPLSVNEVLDDAGRCLKGLGIATVYRSVNALVEEGWIEPVEIAGEPIRYERSGKAHHHHFRCDACDRVFDVKGCTENLRRLLPPKFRLNDHAVTLYGLCARCA